MPIKLNSIKGTLNLITGCGSGLGRATLQRFLKNGSGPILGIDRQFEKDYLQDLELTGEEEKKLFLRTHETFDEKVESSISEFVSLHGSFDNVVNVAGVALAFHLCSRLRQGVYNIKHANSLVEFNTVGNFNIIRLASKYMIDSSLKSQDTNSKIKCIINTSCTSTTSPDLGQSMYAGSKAALDSMTLCIARELSPFNIRCNTINVGFFDTKLIRANEEKIVSFLESIALCPKRLGQPQEFAHLVQAIIENQMINGCCIKIDGGFRSTDIR